MEQKIDGTATIPAETAEAKKPTEETKAETAASPEVKDLQAELEKLKRALSKSNSEAADYKRKYQSTLDETKLAEEKRAEKEAEREQLLATYMERDRISTYKSKLMEAGVDANTADLMAKALPEGVKDEYFEATKTFLGNQRQALDIAALDKQPGLSVGMPPTSTDAKKAEDNKLRGYFGLPPK